MTPDEIEALRGDLPRNCTPHLGNLQQKRSRVEVGTAQHGWLLDAFRRYAELVDRIQQTHPGEPLADLVAFLDEYLGFCKSLEKKDRLFNWRSDFAGSVIPEVLHRLIVKSVKRMGLHPVFSSGNAVVEMTLVGGGRGWNVRHKKQDICLGFEELPLDLADGKRESVIVPLVVIEVKTNLDINKLSGLNFSAESLKRSFPQSLYLIATETVDFSLDDNYVSGSVDEIYVLRKQLRSRARRSLGPLQPDVFEMLIEDLVRSVEISTTTLGHVYDRLDTGKLIGGHHDG